MGGRSGQGIGNQVNEPKASYSISDKEYKIAADHDTAFIGRSGLTGDHQNAYKTINAYTKNGYAIVNPELGKGEADKFTEQFAKNLDKALTDPTVPTFKGHVFRYRDTIRARQILAEAQSNIGGIIEFPNFLSTSTTHLQAKSLLLYDIVSKTGKSIRLLSANPDEEEVLFKRHTKFRILKVLGNLIYMEEI